MSSIDDHIKRMEESRTLGTCFEWRDFKKEIHKLKTEASNKHRISESRDAWKKRYNTLKRSVDNLSKKLKLERIRLGEQNNG